MRKKLIAGNWKMNASRKEAKALIEGIVKGWEGRSDVDVLVIPSFVHLQMASELLDKSAVMLGAQNLYMGAAGAFTGEVSGPMLKEYGSRYVLVGHSERRSLFHDTLPIVAEKFKAAQQANLIPILCVGETLKEREAGKTEEIIHEQLASVIEAVSIDAFKEAVVAYEPVWAIGTGLTATPDQAEAVHAFIRKQFEKVPSIASQLQILYGGSVKADNAKGLLAMPNIDGGLVGGASLDVNGFLAICQAS